GGGGGGVGGGGGGGHACRAAWWRASGTTKRGAREGGNEMSAAVTTAPEREAAPRHRASRRRRRRWTRFILPVYSWLVIAYLVLPILVMVIYSFNKVTTGLPQVSFPWNGFTPQWDQQWNNVPGLTSAFWLSVRLAIATTLLPTI